MANSILYRMPSGVVGSVTRQLETNVESTYMNSAKPVLAFGAPVKMVSGKIEPLEASDLASVFFGIITRVAPSISGSTAQLFASGVPNPEQLQGVAVRGYVNVTCTVGTPARNGQVYARVVTDTGKAIGDLEATADVTVAGGVITGTGTGTIAATVTSAAIVGTWKLTLQTTSQTSLVTVIDPEGVRHTDAVVGTAYTTDGLTFTITAAGTMTAGDSFSPVVTAKNVALSNVKWAVDGKDANNIAELRIIG